jgi:hypothetical protein
VADPVDADSIAEAAAQPASATVEGRTAAAHPIPDQIAAAKFKLAQEALAAPPGGGAPKSGWGSRPTRRGTARFKGGT